MTAAIGALLALGMAVAMGLASSGPADAHNHTPWSQYLGDEGNSRQASVPGPDDPGVKWYRDFDEVEKRWAPQGYEVGSTSGGGRMPLVTEDGTLVKTANNLDKQYETSGSGRRELIGVDPDDGTVLWEVPNVSDRFNRCEPGIDSEGRVWTTGRPNATGGDWALFAIDPADGERIDGTLVEDVPTCDSSVHISGDTLVLFGTSDDPEDVWGIDISADPAQKIWDLEGADYDEIGGGGGFRPGVMTDDSVIFAAVNESNDHSVLEIVQVALEDGSEMARAELPEPTGMEGDDEFASGDYHRAYLMIADDGSLIVGPRGGSPGMLASLDPDSGLGTNWSTVLPDGDSPRGLSHGDGVIVTQPSGSGSVVGISIADGSLSWEGDNVSNDPGYMVTDANGAMYGRHRASGSTRARNIAQLDATGQITWSFSRTSVADELGVDDFDDLGLGGFANITIQPIDGDGTFYIKTRSGGSNHGMLAIDNSGGLADVDGDDRVAGDDRITTAVEISQEFDEADTVLIARSDDYADALAGAPLATSVNGPILLTPPHGLAPAVAAEVERLGADTAYLLGGEAALSSSVEFGLSSAGVGSVQRFAGVNRFDTAAQIAEALPEPSGNAFVVEGTNPDPNRGWPDAVGVSALAAYTQTPILLVTSDVVPPQTQAALEGPDVTEATIVGGSVAVSEGAETSIEQAIGDPGAVERIAGANRYETSAMVADASMDEGMDPANVWTATGRGFADALAAAPVAGSTAPEIASEAGVLLMVDGLDLDNSADSRNWLSTNASAINRVRAVGGTAVITDDTLSRMREAAGIE